MDSGYGKRRECLEEAKQKERREKNPIVDKAAYEYNTWWNFIPIIPQFIFKSFRVDLWYEEVVKTSDCSIPKFRISPQKETTHSTWIWFTEATKSNDRI